MPPEEKQANRYAVRAMTKVHQTARKAYGSITGMNVTKKVTNLSGCSQFCSHETENFVKHLTFLYSHRGSWHALLGPRKM